MYDLSIIIVNYNSETLIDCIQSIRTFNDELKIELIIIDNSNIIHTLYINHADKWVHTRSNIGFGRACNIGIKNASAKTILLLNPDTLCTNDCITVAFKRLSKGTNVGAGVTLINEKGEKHSGGGYFIKGGINHLFPIPFYGRFIRLIAGKQAVKKADGVPVLYSKMKCDFINGAFMMIKKEALEKAGLFDEDFFMYAEEIELCNRLNKIGELCIYSDLSIIHLQSESVNKLLNTSDKSYGTLYGKKGLQLIISNALRIRKQYNAFWFMFFVLNCFIGSIVYTVCSMMYNFIIQRNIFADSYRIKSFAKNIFVLIRYTPKIFFNKSHFYKFF